MATLTRTLRDSWRSAAGMLICAAAMLGPVAARGLASGHGAANAHAESDANEENGESATGFHGVELGEFNIRTTRAVPLQKNRVTFTLHATVTNDEFKQFQRLLKQRRNKVREQVIVATRLVPIEDYDDPDLKKLRRRIQLRLRRILPELRIEDILVSDFDIQVENG